MIAVHLLRSQGTLHHSNLGFFFFRLFLDVGFIGWELVLKSCIFFKSISFFKGIFKQNTFMFCLKMCI
jgi:hypothetical protein